MESYLMMLYVTLEQESALKNFFVDQGWMFCKPDLSVTTDKLGPAVQNPPVVSEEISLPETDIPPQMKQTIPEIKINIPPSKPATGTSTVRRGKRKTKSPKQTAIRIKQAKVASASVPEPSESNENLVTEAVESNKSETLDTSKIKVPITVQVEDGNQFTIKIEQESEDVGNDKGEVDNSDVVGNDDFDDGDDDNDEETNVDYSFEGASTSEGDTSVKMESQSLGNNSTNVNTAAKGGSSGKKPDQKKNLTIRCQICSKVFACKGNLRKHMKRHGEKRITCPVCSKGFYRVDEMRQHLIHIHENRAQYEHICEVCGKMYKSRSSLQSHTYKHCSKPRDDTKCKICAKILSCKKKRLEHEKRHTEGFKISKCTLCNRFFKNSADHKKVCSGMQETEKHECAECGSVFLESKYLANHMKKHHGLLYQCTGCGEAFSDRKTALGHASSCEAAEADYLD
ncbi:zinc finger protein 1 homolog isoform X9 [Mercenaria mercenaria]|uniref:zinc finger protein 1 homolog isoform X9 n=1 Tax=Mercenaria mercenaria TaxID=6596 RepID=UPI00234EDDD5|nr:zinc finger protein 1 homolog isoform X9 [Mercenaria mercenaria]